MLLIFAFSLKTRITPKFPARELLAFYSIQWKAQEFHTETIYWLLFRSITYWKHVNRSAQQGHYTHRIQNLNFQIKYILVFNIELHTHTNTHTDIRLLCLHLFTDLFHKNISSLLRMSVDAIL